MRLQGWVSLTDLAAGFLCSASRRLAASSNTQEHVCLFSQSAAANMAEEAKKLAAYAAVDNHVQVRHTPHTAGVSLLTLTLTACSFSRRVH